MCDLFHAFRPEGKALENNTWSVASCGSVLPAVTGGGEPTHGVGEAWQFTQGDPVSRHPLWMVNIELPAEQLFELSLICCREKMLEKFRSLI